MARQRKQQTIDASAVPLPAEGFEAGGLFVFDARPVVTAWPGKVRVPVGAGQFKTHEVRYDLVYLGLDEIPTLDAAEREFLKGGGKYGDAGDPLMEKLCGWSGIAAQGAGELAYSEANKAKLLASDLVRRSVKEAYARMALGIEEKNSETPPTAGSARPNRSQRRAAGKALQTALKGTE